MTWINNLCKLDSLEPNLIICTATSQSIRGSYSLLYLLLGFIPTRSIVRVGVPSRLSALGWEVWARNISTAQYQVLSDSSTLTCNPSFET